MTFHRIRTLILNHLFIRGALLCVVCVYGHRIFGEGVNVGVYLSLPHMRKEGMMWSDPTTVDAHHDAVVTSGLQSDLRTALLFLRDLPVFQVLGR